MFIIIINRKQCMKIRMCRGCQLYRDTLSNFAMDLPGQSQRSETEPSADKLGRGQTWHPAFKI